MKKRFLLLCTCVGLGSNLLAIENAMACAPVDLNAIASSIHQSSAGKLINITSSDQTFVVVDAQGNRTNVLVKSCTKSYTYVYETSVVANALCDFAQNWQATNNNIFCIAK